MTEPINLLVPTTPLTAERLTYLSRRAVGGFVPMEYFQSLPMWALRGGRLKAVHFLAPSGRSTAGRELLEPSYKVTMDAITARTDEVITILATDFGMQPRHNEVIGVVEIPPGMTGDQYGQHRTELLASMDTLATAFAKDRVALSSAEVEAKTVYESAFEVVGERPIRAYYSAIGNQWFDWLRRAT